MTRNRELQSLLHPAVDRYRLRVLRDSTFAELGQAGVSDVSNQRSRPVAHNVVMSLNPLDGYHYESMGATGYCWAATLKNGLGHYGEALIAVERACDSLEELGIAILVLPELIEAASRSGKTQQAAGALEQLSTATRGKGGDLARGIEARCRALLSHDSAAEGHYQKAIALLSRTRMRIELARAHLLYGEWLRRVHRRQTARQQLRIAQEMFMALGADAFAERARRELLATGETARKRSVDALCELTAQEAQIARLASFGYTNREIGGELFVSPRTVEWHLRKVFQKLGIGSRRELRNLQIVTQEADSEEDLVGATC